MVHARTGTSYDFFWLKFQTSTFIAYPIPQNTCLIGKQIWPEHWLLLIQTIQLEHLAINTITWVFFSSMQLFLTLTTMGSFIPGRLILVNSIYQQLLQYYLRNFYLSAILLSIWNCYKFRHSSTSLQLIRQTCHLLCFLLFPYLLTRNACNRFQYDCLSCYGHCYQWSAQLSHPAGKSYPLATTGIYFSHLWKGPIPLHPEKLWLKSCCYMYIYNCRGGFLLFFFLYTFTTYTEPSTEVIQELTTQREGKCITNLSLGSSL